MRTVSVRHLAALVAIIAAALTWTSSAAPVPHPPSPPTPHPPHPPAPGPDPGCGRVVGDIMPCLAFVRGKAKEPSKGCCRGTKKLSEEAKTPELRKQACECIVHATKGITGVETSLVAEVPKKCGITTKLPPIDASFDCSKITSTIFRGYY